MSERNGTFYLQFVRLTALDLFDFVGDRLLPSLIPSPASAGHARHAVQVLQRCRLRRRLTARTFHACG